MTNQDYIDYLNSVAASNTTTINNLTMQITSLQSLVDSYNNDISQVQNQIVSSQDQITQLQADNLMITDIIALIPTN